MRTNVLHYKNSAVIRFITYSVELLVHAIQGV